MLLRRSAALLVTLCCLLGSTQSATAQSAEEVLRNVYDTYMASIEDVDNFTVVTAMEGDMKIFDTMTAYHTKVEQDGEVGFETQTQTEGGLSDMAGTATPQRSQSNPIAMMRTLYETLADEAVYEGTDTVDGEDVHVLYVEDASALYQDMTDDEAAEDAMQARDARFYVDTDEHVLRKMSMTMEMGEGEQAQTLESVTMMQDYREVGPMLYPYRMTTQMQNPMTPEQRAQMEEAQKQMAEMEKQMANLPEAARERMQKMMDQVANQKGLNQDTIEMTMVVQDLQVNAGPPEGFQE
ncbi:MAG: hypothetical protein GVY18_13980 [Bacteroidetes bacterium]|jgi:hypothetical protein|nr:hypothetical protein [Bacteroidota bacterium]